MKPLLIEAKDVTSGVKAPPIIELSFNNAKALLRNLIGEKGKGLGYRAFFLDIARVEIAAQAIGCAQCALETSLHFISERKKADKKTWDKAGLTIDEGATDSRLTAMARWKAGNIATMAVDEAIGLHEGMGFVDDYYGERFRKDAKITHRAPRTASTRNIKISEILFLATDEIAKHFTD